MKPQRIAVLLLFLSTLLPAYDQQDAKAHAQQFLALNSAVETKTKAITSLSLGREDMIANFVQLMAVKRIGQSGQYLGRLMLQSLHLWGELGGSRLQMNLALNIGFVTDELKGLDADVDFFSSLLGKTGGPLAAPAAELRRAVADQYALVKQVQADFIR